MRISYKKIKYVGVGFLLISLIAMRTWAKPASDTCIHMIDTFSRTFRVLDQDAKVENVVTFVDGINNTEDAGAVLRVLDEWIKTSFREGKIKRLPAYYEMRNRIFQKFLPNLPIASSPFETGIPSESLVKLIAEQLHINLNSTLKKEAVMKIFSTFSTGKLKAYEAIEEARNAFNSAGFNGEEIQRLLKSLDLGRPSFLPRFDGETLHEWLTRDPRSHLDGIYARHSTTALEDVFDPWMRHGEDTDFKEMLKRMNEVTAVGPHGEEPYRYGYSTADINPGKTRDEIVKIYEKLKKETEAIEAQALLDKSLAEKAKKLRKQVETALSDARAAEDTVVSLANDNLVSSQIERQAQSLYNRVGGKVGSMPITEKIRINTGTRNFDIEVSIKKEGNKVFAVWGVEKENTIEWAVTSDGKVQGVGVSHVIPDPGNLKHHIQKGGELLGKVRKLIQESAEKEEILPHISDYYYTMIRALPFRRVNHSLFMNQVNYLLRNIGLHHMRHGDLDYLAYTLSKNQFRECFIDAVNAHQKIRSH